MRVPGRTENPGIGRVGDRQPVASSVRDHAGPARARPARVDGHSGERAPAILAATRNAICRIELLMSPGGALCNPPPWGPLAAVDLTSTSGDVHWEVTLGTMAELSAVPRGVPLELAESRRRSDQRGASCSSWRRGIRPARLRRRDRRACSGRGRRGRPASAQASPMTYRSTSGKQFVEIAMGETPRWRRSAATTSSS